MAKMDEKRPMLPVSPERIEALEEQAAVASHLIDDLRQALRYTQISLAIGRLDAEKDRLEFELDLDVLRRALSETRAQLCRQVLAGVHGVFLGQLDAAPNPLAKALEGMREMQAEIAARRVVG